MKKREFDFAQIARWLAFGIAIVALLVTASCTTADVHYRGSTFEQGHCGTPSAPALIDARAVTAAFHSFEQSHPADALKCSVQSYNKGHPIAYDMAFVELLDRGRTPVEASQQADLHAYLDAQSKQPLSVYVFVHGWRHNAALGDEDVARFHTILALMKSYWNQAGQRDRKVLGVYVGWRGLAVAEPGWGEAMDTVVAIPSFPGRKSQSDQNAQRLETLLLDLESQLNARISAGEVSELVVIGHSLGGNMVLRATRPTLIDRLQKARQGEKISGLGSLVVLLNPASELTEWMALQRASRLHADIAEPDRNSYLTPNECEGLSAEASAESKRRCANEGTAWIYPPEQLPVVVSFTASEHFKKVSSTTGATDLATSIAFPMSQRLFRWPRESSDLVALGHALPVRAFGADGRVDHATPGNRLYGVTHEMEVNRSAKVAARYGEVLRDAEANRGFCEANQRLIQASIQDAVHAARIANPASRGRGWNQEDLWLDRGRQVLQLNVKHEAARGRCAASSASQIEAGCADISGGRQVPRLGDVHDPYWNVGVHPNLIESHGRYVSQNLWCLVHGLATR